ncbi:MAG: 30S ribosomal protein S16 [Candidatus Omnitrophica bacterium]|nr:30S ribosomal protein S16 [Candidatus Omnitrophota bacterium]
MAVRIRLRRIGKNPKKKPHWRITVFDERVNRDGRFIEEIGSYNPISKAASVNLERYSYWLGKGALASPGVKIAVKKAQKTAVKEA